MRTILTGIDIGTSNIHVVVVSFDSKTERLTPLAIVRRRSRGLRRGYIVSGEEVTASLREALTEAEKTADTRIRRAIVGVSGMGLSMGTSIGTAAISRADAEIGDLDIARVIAECEKKILEQPNQKILHTLPLEFKLDGKKIVGRPHGMRGTRLEARCLFALAHSGHFNQLVKAVEGAGVEIEDIVASPLAESLVALNPVQKSAGSILVNIGAETVSTIVFEEGLPRAIQVFPLGGTDITNDIALGLKISLEEASRLKTSPRDERPRTLQKKIDEIVDARLSDIFELVDGHLKKIGRGGLLPAGVIFTGGSSRIPEITDIAKDALRLPVVIGENNLSMLETGPRQDSRGAATVSPRVRSEELRDPEWSVAYGLCVLGTHTEQEDSGASSFFQKIKKFFARWIQQFLP